MSEAGSHSAEVGPQAGPARRQSHRCMWDSSQQEAERLRCDKDRTANWKRWGPYLSERQWGTVREDYSEDGSAWDYFPHDHARSRAYRWGEDGLLGIADRQCRLCFGLALWNGQDDILKERLFGLTGSEGNHGEDVKELYYYLDSTPTHSYMRAMYRYPQSKFPYEDLVKTNSGRGRLEDEYDLEDTGMFRGAGHWDVVAEYHKESPNDVLIKVTIVNRGEQAATLHVIPQAWFRNTWSWGREGEDYLQDAPTMEREPGRDGMESVRCVHPVLGEFLFRAEAKTSDSPKPLFTNNETNHERLFGTPLEGAYVKDAFHRYVVGGDLEAINPSLTGTKVGMHYKVTVEAGASDTFCLRLTLKEEEADVAAVFGDAFDKVCKSRKREADRFFRSRQHDSLSSELRLIQRQAYAGLMWSKQFYYYSVKEWLEGDPVGPPPSQRRLKGRNKEWTHLFNRDVISMPDKWEYPWFAAWDLAFHMIPFSIVDPEFAKDQLVLLLREWYMHPNGQIPAYEWALGDVNPPVHAWAVWRVFKTEAPRGKRDVTFLKRCFTKLILNFQWWVNRKDPNDTNIFGGGFLGLDNIGVIDRSQPLPGGGALEQADGTSWMAFFCVTMLDMAIELARHDRAYDDIASKFFEHFVQITDAVNTLDGHGLWHEEDGFYYDAMRVGPDTQPLKVRSMVGLTPLFAVLVIRPETLHQIPGFAKRMAWFLDNRKDLADQVISRDEPGRCTCEHSGTAKCPCVTRLLAVPTLARLQKVLAVLFDEDEFLSPFGIRSLSLYHKDHPFVTVIDGKEYRVSYCPGESDTELFGGNSNWRGPIWFPVNYLLIEALERYHYFYGDDLQVEVPTGSGNLMNLRDAAAEVARRLSRLFTVNGNGERPCHFGKAEYKRPDWQDQVLFYEYFDPETGRGVGASHQTGWTALIARCIDRLVLNGEPTEGAQS